jgi:hypothetical protein
VIARVLVLLAAMLLLAAPSERVHADICDEAAAVASFDEAELVAVTEMSPARDAAAIIPLHAEAPIAPAPALASIFRPPRTTVAGSIRSRV